MASLIDSILFSFLLIPFAFLLNDHSTLYSLLAWVLPPVVILIFWAHRSATPGKIMCHMKIVHAQSLQQPDKWQFAVRYIAYYISMIPLFLGFFWVAFDAKKQGWHDKIAGTVVVMDPDQESKGSWLKGCLLTGAALLVLLAILIFYGMHWWEQNKDAVLENLEVQVNIKHSHIKN